MRIIFFIILLSILYSDTFSILQNVIAGFKANTNITRNYPDILELKKISFEIDNSGYEPLKIISLISAESKFDKSGFSYKKALGICQLMPDTKRYLLFRIKETNQNSCIQDIRCMVYLLNECRDTIGTNEFRYLVYAYNAGAGTVKNREWIKYSDRIYIQPKDLYRNVQYFYNNYKNGIYDIDTDYVGYRYSKGKFYSDIAFAVNEKYKTIYIDTRQMIMWYGKQWCFISAGKFENGKTSSPKGHFRIIWKLKYSLNEGGAFGACALRLNYMYATGKSAYIHGTPAISNIGKYTTGGCIATYNSNALQIYNNYDIGDYVVIY